MADTDATVTVETDEATEEETVEGDLDVQIDPDLGAKKAILAERQARREAEKELKALRQLLEDKDKPADEQALEQARREALAEANARANERIVKAELKAAATGKVKNPSLALKLIDTSGIDVSDDGEADSDAIAVAINNLLDEYPELSADAGKFHGSADQGAKGKDSKPAQMTVAELQRLKDAGDHEAIVQARAEGRLNTILGIKN